jgi:hypothetical protein
MPITATPIDLRDLVVPDNLSDILQKGGKDKTPTFDAVLSKHRKLVSGLRRQVWPVATDPAPEPADPTDEPEAAPNTEPADEPETSDPTPDVGPHPGGGPTVDR